MYTPSVLHEDQLKLYCIAQRNAGGEGKWREIPTRNGRKKFFRDLEIGKRNFGAKFEN